MNIFAYLLRKDLIQPAEQVKRTSERGWLANTSKRCFDIFTSLIGLVLLSPVFLAVAILIRLDTAGPVFYRGVRLGRWGKPFRIVKFRTMYDRPASYQGSIITAKGDERITPFGQRLRDTKLNELPQLWNVLIGEMSLVGPRPEDPAIAAKWPEQLRYEILSVRPGITSPSSVAYHDEERRLNASSIMHDYFERIQPDKLRLDLLYVRHHSFMTDLDAIFWTLVILVPRFGEKKIPEGWLIGGPFLRFWRNYLNWFVTDFFLAFVSIGFVGVLWRFTSPLNVGLVRAVVFSVVLAFLFGLLNTFLGVKSVSWSHAAAEDVFRLFISCGLVILVGTGLHLLIPSAFDLPMPFVFTASLVVLLSCVMARYRFRLLTGLASRWITLRRSGYGAGERVLIVGAGEGGSFAAWLLQHSDFQRLYTVAGIVDDDPAKQGIRYEGFEVLGTTADIPGLVRELDIGVIFYAISRISPLDNERILSECKKTRTKIVMISNVMRILHDQLATGAETLHETRELLNKKTQPRAERA